jgi:hypothetical protein
MEVLGEYIMSSEAQILQKLILKVRFFHSNPLLKIDETMIIIINNNTNKEFKIR